MQIQLQQMQVGIVLSVWKCVHEAADTLASTTTTASQHVMLRWAAYTRYLESNASGLRQTVSAGIHSSWQADVSRHSAGLNCCELEQ